MKDVAVKPGCISRQCLETNGSLMVCSSIEMYVHFKNGDFEQDPWDCDLLIACETRTYKTKVIMSTSESKVWLEVPSIILKYYNEEIEPDSSDDTESPRKEPDSSDEEIEPESSDDTESPRKRPDSSDEEIAESPVKRQRRINFKTNK